MTSILGLGVVDIALALLVIAPLALGYRKNEAMSAGFHSLFQICLAVGFSLLMVAGFMAIAG